MCDVVQNFWIYTSCADPGVHFVGTAVDGSWKQSCSRGPHERYIVMPEQCPLCHG
ncbi:hypothetical protein B0T18DRAFT_315506 [Schizothecium vesticola]|uniref:Uncharacterized protein n=1 Tax=Schizothecium vesticola TaxID=314040 RepID=A0AA40KCJ8_9PEZI|nr:hypothetical protein B0T18DRAFT_315506 [Schizothecium vesticola]